MSDSETDLEERGRLRRLFDAALDQPTGRRAAWIAANAADADERGALERLVAIGTQDTAEVLATPAAELASRIGIEEETRAESLIGQRIDRFRLVRLLGQGGMAAVFLGEREDADFTQQVAIKLLRRGLYSELEQRLFRRERQALAMLSHPNIAHLLDGGVTEAGIPYLVMDYIDGVPITQYAVEHALDLQARLKLFAMVCRAVDAAHRQLIVHRDLKPSNILVDAAGEAKLLDFGIAKLLDEDDGATRTGLAALTPGYAAPEQYDGGPISTATDVYALGVVLHELLVGARPEPDATKRPSALKTELRGDLDNIILKALASEPERRYASAGAFADDIERYLDGQPVAAHPPSWRYRARKFVRRHRAGVIVSALATLGLVAAGSAILWQSGVARQEAERATQQAARATQEAARATQQAERAEAMRRFLFDAFAEAVPSKPRSPPTIVEVVEQALARLRRERHMHAHVRTELLTELGRVLLNQGRIDLAKEVLQETFDQAARQFGPSHALTLAAGEVLAWAQIGAGDYAAARGSLDRQLASVPIGNARARSKLLVASARLALQQRELSRARAEIAEAVQLARQADDEEGLASALDQLGDVQHRTHDSASAISTYEELLTRRTKLFGVHDVRVAEVHQGIAKAYRGVNDLDRAESHARRGLEMARAVLPKDDVRLGAYFNSLMIVQSARRDFVGARRSAEESLRIYRIVFGSGDHPDIATALNNIGTYGVRLEDPAAVTPLRESVRVCAATWGEEHVETAITRATYGVALTLAGEITAGDSELRHAIASMDNLAEPDPRNLSLALEKLSLVKLERGDATAALPLIERLAAVVVQVDGAGAAYWDGRVPTLRATVSLQIGRPSDAFASLRVASSALARSKNPDPVLAVEVPLLQAQAARALGDIAAAEKAFAQGDSLLAELRHPPSRLTRLAQRLREGSAPTAK